MLIANRHTRDQATGATAEPVTLEEAKEHCNITHTSDDALISALIQTATDHTETYLNRTLMEKSVTAYCDIFPGHDHFPIALPYPPLITVTSIKYYDTDDVQQTWSSTEYVVNTNNPDYGMIYPAQGYSWPTMRNDERDSVEIIYTAGYADTGGNDPADKIPVTIKHAIMLLISHLYENREATTIGHNFKIDIAPLAYEALLSHHRLFRF